jgi:hypothetical protein
MREVRIGSGAPPRPKRSDMLCIEQTPFPEVWYEKQEVTD